MSKKNSMTAAEFLAMSKKSSGKSKYGNVRTRGKHSKKEADYGDMLQLLYENKLPFRNGGKILCIDEQWRIQIRLPMSFFVSNPEEVVTTYIADYRVCCENEIYYIDVKPTFKDKQSEKEYKKGAAYQLYNLKRKLVEAFHGIKITEV